MNLCKKKRKSQILNRPKSDVFMNLTPLKIWVKQPQTHFFSIHLSFDFTLLSPQEWSITNSHRERKTHPYNHLLAHLGETFT